MITVAVNNSRIGPNKKASISVYSDNDFFNGIEARATAEGAPYGRGWGYDLLKDDYQTENGVLPLNEVTDLFNFDAEADELGSDGIYRISVYVRNLSGIWNDCCGLYINTNERVKDSGGSYVLAKRDGSGTDEQYISAYSGDDIDNFVSGVLKNG